jgi:hypothetical protein
VGRGLKNRSTKSKFCCIYSHTSSAAGSDFGDFIAKSFSCDNLFRKRKYYFHIVPHKSALPLKYLHDWALVTRISLVLLLSGRKTDEAKEYGCIMNNFIFLTTDNNMIKSSRLRWTEHVAWIRKVRNTFKM